MSHYTRHLPVSAGGVVRHGIIGGGIVATGLLGFFYFLNQRHERSMDLDRSGKPNNISSWESRLVKHNASSFAPDHTVLRAARVEARSSPLPIVKMEHDAHHRTYSQEAADVLYKESNGLAAVKGVYEVPTAQRDGSDGFVYTKGPAWYWKKLTGKKDNGNGSVKPVGEGKHE